MTLEFKKWPKIPRWENAAWIITEKIDGTNACVVIDEEGNIGAQSRNSVIYPGKQDNFGFAQWVEDHKDELLELGPGYHYGEWWGQGIQRGYGLKEKRFSLFNWWIEDIPDCCRRIPILGENLEIALFELKLTGSKASPGFMDVEGVVLTNRNCSTDVNLMYKYILRK